MKVTVRADRTMGSPLRLTLAGACNAEADHAWRIVQSTFVQAERDLTRFDASSALSRLNRRAGTRSVMAVPPMLARALAAAWRAFRTSHGRFDPRIIGALEEAGERAGVPLPASPRVLRRRDRWLALDPRRSLARLAAPVDLGGIGKGLALRWTAAALRRGGHGRFLLSAGGDIVAAGSGPADRPWVVGIEDPATGGSLPVTLELTDAAVATSSIAMRAWCDAEGRPRHHIIDPATLVPAEPVWAAVTVVDADPAWAEVSSKVAFLAGHDIGRALAGRRAWWVDSAGRLYAAA